MIVLAASLLASVMSVTLSAPPSTGASEPRWSPDARRIAYVEGAFPTGREIMIMEAGGSKKTRLTTNESADEYPTISPDGRTILFSTNRDGVWKLYLMNVDGSHQRDLGIPSTSSDPDDPCRAEWSPDGTKIVFPMTRDGARTLHVVNRDGSGLAPVPEAAGLYPAWSPGGKAIAYYSRGNIHIQNIDGSNKRQLTAVEPGSEARAIYPQWSADGRTVFHLKGEQIASIKVDGSGERILTDIPGKKWYLSVSRAGRFLYTCIEKSLDVIHALEKDGKGLLTLA